MRTVVELCGPPAVGKTSLAGALCGRMSVVAEQVRALLLEPDPPPPGAGRQVAVARRIAAEVTTRPDGPVLVDIGWLSLVSFGYAEWPVPKARAVADAVAGAASGAGECRHAGLVVLGADDDELRRRAAADARTGRRRGDLDRNLARAGVENALLDTAETVLPRGMVLRPRSRDVRGRADEVREWLAAEGPTMVPAEFLLRVAEAWSRTPLTARRPRTPLTARPGHGGDGRVEGDRHDHQASAG